jgi:Ca2+-binding RTX toxin-like protein
MTLRTLFLTSLLALAAAPGAAHASTAGLSSGTGDGIVYAADPGEANDVTVSAAGKQVVFEDSGATITAGDGCTSADPHRVICGIDVPGVISVLLEDGDDSVQASGPPPSGSDFFYVDFDGAAGADTLRAGSWPASLTGGVGADVLEGGPGSPILDGLDVYATNGFALLPLQAPEQDQITCAAAPNGPLSATEVRADGSDKVSGACGQVAVYGPKFALIRGTDGDDSLAAAGPGPTRIYGLGGADAIQTGGDDRAYGGPGNDNLSGSGVMLGGKDDDRIAADSPARIGGEDGDDAITGSDGPDRIDGGPGADSISAHRGADRIQVRDGERDVVRCGPGRDRVIADKKDSVARDCERVSRVSAPLASARATAARNTRCVASKAKGSRIVVKTSKAVMWTRGTFANYACLYAQGKVRHLPDEGGGFHALRGAGGVKLAGRYVAYATPGSAIGDEFDRMYVYDIRAGHPVIQEASNSIGSIALKPNGSVAWIQYSLVRPANSDTNVFEVRKESMAERQGNVLIERAAGIGPRSLKLTGDGASVTWTRDGATRTAPLG